MRYLNLSPGFNPFEKTHPVKFKALQFSGGEPHIRLEGIENIVEDTFVVTQRITSFNDLGLLLAAIDALKETGKASSIHLLLPYFPGARQDRRVNWGEPLTVKIYADIINSLNLNSVTIVDPHSDVAPALINNCKVITNVNFAIRAIKEIRLRHRTPSVGLVAPDLGATKKLEKVAAKYEHPFTITQLHKERDLETGKIVDITVLGDTEFNVEKPYIIIDDICDGGGTFIGTAQALKDWGVKHIYLVVTHGIFSKGFRELNKYFDGIYTTDSFPNIDNPYFCMKNDNKYNKVTQIKLGDDL